jgi:all-trans-retinol 13,14-reductase
MSRNFDAIVVGSGLGGLTAGGLCARAGMKVLVVERNEVFGGAATTFSRDGLAIESSLHEIDGFDEDDPKLPLLRSLGLDRSIDFVDVGDLYEVRGATVGQTFSLPHGLEAAVDATTARFPAHKSGLEEYFRRLTSLRAAVSFAARHSDDRSWWLRHAFVAVRKLWPILSDGRATLGEVMRELFGGDEAVKLVLAANLGYWHDDPEQMSFISFAIAQASYVLGGGHYVRGGSQALTNKMVALIGQAGGVLEAGREARRLLTKDHHVVGVEHCARDGTDGKVDATPVVFGNASPNVLASLLPNDERASFAAHYANRRQSISLWTVSLGLNRAASEFGVRRYSTFIQPPWLTSLAQMREAVAVMSEPPRGRMPPYVFVDYHQIDSGLNEAAPFLVSFCGTDRIENWSWLGNDAKTDRKNRWIDALISDIDRQFPGIATAVMHRDMATAETMQRYLNTPGGAVYGFAPVDSLL